MNLQWAVEWQRRITWALFWRDVPYPVEHLGLLLSEYESMLGVGRSTLEQMTDERQGKATVR